MPLVTSLPVRGEAGQFFNPGPRVVYVLLGPGKAGPGRYTVKLLPGAYYEPAEAWVGREVSWWEDFPLEGRTRWDRLLLGDGDEG